MDLVVSMPPNPSHLEAVDPVVEGMARAAGTSDEAVARRASTRRAASRFSFTATPPFPAKASSQKR